MTNDREVLQYQGYLKTETICLGTLIDGIENVQLNNAVDNLKDIQVKNSRLGKLVEQFVFHQLQQKESIKWICDNLQVQNDKLTIGELDALFYDNNSPIHLEIVYKFYLYDALKAYSNPLEPWIGPNRKDNLLYKLDKLKNKQFPLLYNELTKVYIKKYHLKLNAIKQQLCFKAQLFLPYNSTDINIAPLNNKCVEGFYISFKNFEVLSNCKFHVPKKLDWLIIPHNEVTWLDYDSTLTQVKDDINNKRSPLVWVKYNDEKLAKCFITFW